MALELNPKGKKSEDIISKLPEVINQHILSFLPMKDAVRTSVLSKTWEYLWVSLPNLMFGDLSFDEHKDFVDRALHLREYRLQKFSLVCRVRKSFYVELPLLQRWITALVSRNVEDLRLGFHKWQAFFSFELLYPLLASASLTRLSVVLLHFKFPRLVFSSLKHLVLERVILRDAKSVDNLFTSCPMLETTSLLQCNFQCNIRVYAPKLCKLEISEEMTCHCGDGYHVIISAPSLNFFSLECNLASDYCLRAVPSLDEAIIGIPYGIPEVIRERFQRLLGKLLKGISHVKKLSFSYEDTEKRFLLPEVPFFNNLAILSFGSRYDTIRLDKCIALMKILQNSPLLETLRFENGIGLPTGCKKGRRILNSVPPCFLSCLKRVDIVVDNDGCQILTMNAVKIFLERAAVLEKVIIYIPNRWTMKKAVDKEKLLKGLIELPRTSQVCQFEFVYSAMQLSNYCLRRILISISVPSFAL